ncbi:MAG: hypothetical protein LIP16_15240 [Clostridium sp.]|nr:hypothetical protein [Clostridium sp.]
MSIERIDSVSGVDPASINFSNLRWKYGTGVDTSTGKGIYKKHSYRNGVMTELGDIELKVWFQLMEQLIEKSGEQWLQNALLQWEKEHNYAKASAAKLQESALELHSARIFDDPEWVCYIPFNKRFRPDVLEQAQLVTVINECCGLPGEVTQEQIDRAAYNGSVCCPHCGRWSPFKRVGENNGAPGMGIFRIDARGTGSGTEAHGKGKP